jgi:hypothetical protein
MWVYFYPIRGEANSILAKQNLSLAEPNCTLK